MGDLKSSPFGLNQFNIQGSLLVFKQLNGPKVMRISRLLQSTVIVGLSGRNFNGKAEAGERFMKHQAVSSSQALSSMNHVGSLASAE